MIGFCMGGGLALMLGCERPDLVKAVVPFYGLIPWANAQPDYSKLDAAVQGHFAEKDDNAGPKAGPVVRRRSPEQAAAESVHVATYHMGLALPSYTYHARNIVENCCVIAIPQPDSFGFHQMSV